MINVFFYHDIFYFITCLTCIVVSIHFRLSWTLSSQTSSPFRTDTKNLQRKMLNWSKHCLLPLKHNSSMWYLSFGFQEWSACYFSLHNITPASHIEVTRKRKWSPTKEALLLFVKQISLVSTLYREQFGEYALWC